MLDWRKNFLNDHEIDGVHYELYACFKELPKCLTIPYTWYKEIKEPWLQEDASLPKDLNGKWLIAFCTIDYGCYWADEETNFVSMMRLADYCNQLYENKDDNLLFYKFKIEVPPKHPNRFGRKDRI